MAHDPAGRVTSVVHNKGVVNLSRTEYEYNTNGKSSTVPAARS